MKVEDVASAAATAKDLEAFVSWFPTPALVFPATLRIVLGEFLNDDGGTEDATELVATTKLALLKPKRVDTDPASVPLGRDIGDVVVFLKKRSTWAPFSDVFTVGRASNQDVCLPLESVSKFHACFTGSPNGWRVTDQRATNGTFVDAKQLPPGGSAWLHEGTTVAFGPEATARFFTPKGLYVVLCSSTATDRSG